MPLGFPQEEPTAIPSCCPGGPTSFLLDGGPRGWGGYKGPGGEHPGTRRRAARTGRRTLVGRSLGTHHPEAMLLWLTLALLWSTTCWAKQMYGEGGGKYFSTSSDCEITGIRVAVGLLGLVKSIQVRCGVSWSTVFGAPGGTTQEFILQPGEHIQMIYGSYRVFIRSLIISTDQGRYATFGKESGNTFIVSPSEDGKVLTGICGQHKFLGLSGLCFEWDYPLEDEEWTTEPNSTRDPWCSS
ncbi:zymogen granule protein 16 homolog B [Phoca vitulina]|uniref:zymogen granule protein 16 homolog B n=1 Tax=Phoca vitulina TaxID=9720 RepID=UPI0013962B5D|nr:zymogen granule protein 16 homolog B [Phoca vitulina]